MSSPGKPMPMDGEKTVSVVIVGAAGRMGREALKALGSADNFEIVGAVVRPESSAMGELAALDVVFEDSLEAVANRTRPDVIVDLSTHAQAVDHARIAGSVGAGLVIGCTGLSEAQLDEIEFISESAKTGAIYAPNFAIGAVLMMRFAAMAAQWIPDVEIIEMHHDRKVDAPSGTALHTADMIVAARTGEPTSKPTPLLKLEGARGGEREGVHIHSVRLPGLLAHQQVIFGGPGEVLTIRHDAMDRSVYMGGLKLCVRRVRALVGLTVGLDKILFPA